jgi:nicotinate-nucleotide adenylyltransferase
MKIEGNILKGIDDSRSDVFMAKLESGRDAILLRLTPLGISSTEIRKLIRQGKSIKYLLPPEVQSYIITHKLYRS